ncbi:MAG TPA: hypothetical protein VFY92_01335 [Hyphomicrobiaceae bacterium]|nr:hypothetical protein [Hyphomicrobiaceae bacterium]
MQRRRAAPAASGKEGQERDVDALLVERDRLMSEISLRAALKSLPPMLVKARTLLTRYWGKANWEARAEILAVARMLLTLGAAQPALRLPRAAPVKQPKQGGPAASQHRKATG